jgi:glutathione S-transferase
MLHYSGEMDKWLHFNHTLRAGLTHGHVAPKMFGFSHSAADAKKHASTAKRALTIIDTQLASTKAFVLGDTVSIVDLQFYEEIGQCDREFFDAYDFSAFVNVTTWLRRMRSVPHYEEAHEGLVTIVRVIKQNGAAKL